MSNKAEKALEGQAKTCHESIEWWKTEMSALINESDAMEENPHNYPDYEDRMENIRLKMNYLLFKGEWENKQLFLLQEKINKFKAEKPYENFELIEKKEKFKRKKRK